jgi:hypothetical protein
MKLSAQGEKIKTIDIRQGITIQFVSSFIFVKNTVDSTLYNTFVHSKSKGKCRQMYCIYVNCSRIFTPAGHKEMSSILADQ